MMWDSISEYLFLRSSVTTLRSKLDNLEYSLGSGSATPKQQYTAAHSGINTPLYINTKSSQLYDNGIDQSLLFSFLWTV